MKLRAGLKLHSSVCDTQVVVVRAPAEASEIEIGCGGAPMSEDDGPKFPAQLDEALGEGPLIGKRYADDALGLELLCVRAGKGALTLNGVALAVKGAKPLPASD